MEYKMTARVAALLLMIAAIIGLFALKMYDLQVVNANDQADSAQVFSLPFRVTAARGNILDRNGNVLVTNRASYNLILINDVLFSSDNPNESLRKLAAMCLENGYEINDHLPVTREKPYEYTLTEMSSVWQGYYRDFLESRDWDPDISAAQLIKLLKGKYNIPMEWTEEETRMVLSIRYELDLRRCTNLPTYTLMNDVSPETLANITELGVPGLNVESSTVRQYNTKYAAHILGHIGLMNAEEYEIYEEQGYSMDAYVGKDGLEYAFESELHGTDGIKTMTIAADGKLISEVYSKEPKAGNNVELTIDINLQAVAEQTLEKTILDLRQNGVGAKQEGKDAEGGAVVAVDVNTGDILACASYPTFDPSTYSTDYNELLKVDYSPLFNRALLAIYNPGSTFKMVTALAAINNGVIGRYYPIEDQGIYTYYKEQNFMPRCYYYTSSGGQTHGTIDVMQALSVSCNYYFYEIGRLTASTEGVGWEAVDETAKQLGLGENTGVELPEETGYRANAETKRKLYGEGEQGWYGADVLMASIGQSENKFTPLQLCVYTAALATGGTRYKATFLNRVISSDYTEVIMENEPVVLSQLEMTEEAKAAVHDGMRMAATSGTASTAFANYEIPVCAKTGTVQTDLSIARLRSDSCSFVCYAPADNPQIAIAVYVENGAQGGNLGYIARAILDAYFSEKSSADTYPSEHTFG